MINKRFGKLIVLEEHEKNKYAYYKCKCDCGNITIVQSSHLKNGHTKSCGCLRWEKASKHLIGRRFGKLTVLEFYGQTQDKSKSNLWKCKCDCGNEYIARGGSLLSGHTKSCGCYHRERMFDLHFKDRTGERYGRLIAVGLVGKNKSGQYLWKCQCDCGNKTIVTGSHLTSGHTRSCGCLSADRHEEMKIPFSETALNDIYRSYKNGAKIRGYDFRFTKEEFKKLVNQSCFYCGSEPSNKASKHPYKDGEFVYNGIDRIDNSRGYEIGNVVPCCFICNRAKHTLDIVEFLNWINQIAGNKGYMEDRLVLVLKKNGRKTYKIGSNP